LFGRNNCVNLICLKICYLISLKYVQLFGRNISVNLIGLKICYQVDIALEGDGAVVDRAMLRLKFQNGLKIKFQK
jgi:hypothetical protein